MLDINQLFLKLSAIVWGPLLIVLLLGCGIFFTFKLRFIQLREFFHGFAAVLGFYDQPEHKGEISHLQALSTALSATIGVGNIAGVATAIALGGPGAIFWMWLTGIFGMATKFASCTLGHKFRELKNGKAWGGPMYYIEKGLGNRALAIFFSICCAIAALGIGNMVQANSVADALATVFKVPPLLSGFVLMLFVWAVIVGGIKRIARIAQALVPLMCIFYIGTSIFILLANWEKLADAFAFIFGHAFKGTAPLAGFAGAGVLTTMRMGIARGVFSNEAGLGSAPIAHAAARTDQPAREGLVAMIGPFIDTIVVCSMTALIIIVSGMWQEGKTGASLTTLSFSYFAGNYGSYIVSIAIIFFAFSTLIGWAYYGEVAVRYLFKKKMVNLYRWIFCLVIPLGALLRLELVWNISDLANGLMAFPNLIALFLLSKVVSQEAEEYLSKQI